MIKSGISQPPLPFERWLDVPGFEDLYRISNTGQVWSYPRHGTLGGPLKPSDPDHDGYLAISLSRLSKKYTFKVHRLVMLTFVGPRPEGLQVRHLDGDPLNNRWEPGDEAETIAAGGNLVYGTPSENMLDRARHGTWSAGDRRGECHPMAVLTEALVREIRQRHAAGETITSLAVELGISKWTLYSAARGDRWPHVA